MLIDRMRFSVADAAHLCNCSTLCIRRNVKLHRRGPGNGWRYTTMPDIIDAWTRSKSFREACGWKFRKELHELMSTPTKPLPIPTHLMESK